MTATEARTWQLEGMIYTLYEALLEADECHTAHFVKLYAREITMLGVDIGYEGLEQLFDSIKLNDQLSRQYAESNEVQSKHYAEEAERERELARFLGWNVVEEAKA